MIKTICTCDRCGRELNTESPANSETARYKIKILFPASHVEEDRDLCNRCLFDFGDFLNPGKS